MPDEATPDEPTPAPPATPPPPSLDEGDPASTNDGSGTSETD